MHVCVCIFRTLLAMLTTFSKFHNPKAFYRQEGEEEGMEVTGVGVKDVSVDGFPVRSKVKSGRSHSGSKKKTR